LSPQLWEIPRIIRVQAADAPLPPNAIVVVREAEGTTVIESVADHTPSEGEPQWAQITLAGDPSSEWPTPAPGVAAALANAGVPCRRVAALHHEHLFVPWAQRDAALAALKTLSTEHR
jgi:hypothetical protein